MNAIIDRYNRDLDSNLLLPDQAQSKAIAELQNLQNRLLDRHHFTYNLILLLKNLWKQRFGNIKGVYLYGGVGRGKTYMMDLFYETLPIKEKLRIHFHRFMLKVHTILARLEGHSDPLEVVARQFSKTANVICFDEFYVADIADAMLLSRLMKYLFAHGVVLVFTSNSHPKDLYFNGLQRQRFLGAITLIEANNVVIKVDSGVDYRFNILSKVGIYHLSQEDKILDRVREEFNSLTANQPIWGATIDVCGREVSAIACDGELIWFSFESLCCGPRSTRDYIEISNCYNTVVISVVPTFTSKTEDHARRFIILIDELYDRKVNIVIIAEAMPEALYQGELLNFQFKRTVSRLMEMQTEEYISSSKNS